MDGGEGDDGGGEDEFVGFDLFFFVEYIVENVSLSFVRVGNILGELLVLGMNSSGTCISYLA